MEGTIFYHYFIKTWYDGQAYSGSQFQPGLRTVDGAIVDALRELRYFPTGPPHTEYFKVAGRTDKGVSALSAVYYIRVVKPLHPGEVNERLKTQGHPIMIWSVAKLPEPQNPRQARHRVYKYFHVLARQPININMLRDGLAALSGDHDFKGFTKAKINPEIRTARTLDVATVDREGDVLVFTFKSKGFLWEQVRRMVAFLIENANDAGLAEKVNSVLHSGDQPNMEPAPPGGLVLWNVEYGPEITWEDLDDCGDQFFKVLRARYVDVRSRSAMLEAIHSMVHENRKNKEKG